MTRWRGGVPWVSMAAAAIAMVALTAALAGATGPSDWQVETVEPRAYGHRVGDVVVRRVTVFVPAGHVLDEATLPRTDRRGMPIELRRLTREPGTPDAGGGGRLRLTLTYQVFIAPAEVRTFELPHFVLRFDPLPTAAAQRPQEVRIDGWPLTVSPLVPLEVSPRQGLGEWQPDAPPPLIDTRAAELRLLAYSAVAVVLLAGLALRHIGMPWVARQRQPFNAAWRALKALPPPTPAAAAPAQRRQAFQQLHAALNQSAGEVVFEQTIDRFIAEQPRFAGLRDDLALFFQRSRAEFFGPPGAADSSAGEGAGARAWLIAFSRKCRDAERGAP